LSARAGGFQFAGHSSQFVVAGGKRSEKSAGEPNSVRPRKLAAKTVNREL
jgi:hypothetical protein